MAQIALTTIFTPPSSCLDNSYTSYGGSVYVKDVKVQSSECYPEGFQSLWSLGSPFSPGVCPESYGAVSSQSDQDVTTALCCPGSMTAHDGELGCYSEVNSATLALPTGVVTVQSAVLAIHGVLVMWASSDLSVLPAMPASSTTTVAASTTQSDSSSTESESSTTSSAPTAPTSSTVPTRTLTVTPLTTITESATQMTKSRTTDHASDAAAVTTDILSPESSSTSSATSTTSTTPSPASNPPQSLPPGTIAGISIGAIAGVAILAVLSALLIRRRRRRAQAYPNELEVRVFDSAAQFHEDKKKPWSPLSSSFGSRSRQTEMELSEADSRVVQPTISELEGNGR